MVKVGLTGGIGAGKSTVAGRLRELGATVIDADQLAREVVEPGTSGLAAVVEQFGPQVLRADGSLDRPALGKIVFGEAEQLARLNAIVHPLIGERTRALIEAAEAAELGAAAAVAEAAQLEEAAKPGETVQLGEVSATGPVLVHDVPLLVENQLAGGFDLVIVVDAPEAERIRRLVMDRGMTEGEARARIAAQADDAARRRVADVWIDNSGAPEATTAQVDAAWRDRIEPLR